MLKLETSRNIITNKEEEWGGEESESGVRKRPDENKAEKINRDKETAIDKNGERQRVASQWEKKPSPLAVKTYPQYINYPND